MPILMGYGTYWALNPNESKALTEQTENLLKSIPAKHRKQIMEVMNTWLPLSSFMVTVGMITWPRLQLTRLQIAEMKGGGYAPPSTDSSGTSPNVADKKGGENTGNNPPSTPQREHPFANLVHA